MSKKATNVFWQDGYVRREDRERRNGNRGVVLWLTGLPASGKTTVAIELERRLFARGRHCYRLDGDNIRHGLNSDLGFSPEDRDENIRRIGEVAKLFADAGLIAITSFISPYRRERDRVRASIDREGDFVEVHVDCSLEECERRDPKGLYARARAGEIPGFTGVSAPYEAPESPEIVIRTDHLTALECADRIYRYLAAHGYVGSGAGKALVTPAREVPCDSR